MDFFTYPGSPEIDSALQAIGLRSSFYLKNNEYHFTVSTLETLKELHFNKSELDSLQSLISHSKRHSIETAQEELLQSRVHFSIDSYLQDPPSSDCFDEVFLLLLLNPEFSYQYVGRGISPSKEVKSSQLHQLYDYFYLDSAGGKRQYCWRVVSVSDVTDRVNPSAEFSGLKNWLSEPGSRVVLCLGGGGFRLFAIPTLLKIIDLLKQRKSIGEIWGSSGGAIAGGLYSKGVSPHAIEQLGYDFYNNKYPEFEIGKAVFKAVLQIAKKKLKNMQAQGFIEIVDLFKEVGKKALARRNLLTKEIPFFSIGSSITRKSHVILTEEKNIPEYADDSMCAVDLISAFTASSSIPILFEPFVLNLNAIQKDLICDGVISEDVPLVLPYLKWVKDRTHHPDQTERKLKILYLDLGLRLSESKLVKWGDFPFSPVRPLVQLGKIVDTFLNGRIQQACSLLNTLPNVEVIGVQLEINQLAVLSPFQVPHIIQQGRKDLLMKLRKLSSELETKQQSQTSKEDMKKTLSRSSSFKKTRA